MDKMLLQQAQSTNEGHRLMPAVYTFEQGQPITSKALGPTVHYMIEGSHVFYLHIQFHD